MRLYGRHDERAALGRLLAGVRGGQGGVLVLRGEAGAGKTALLDDAAEAAADLRVIRAAGVESEMEIAFAALHQLCVPVLDRLEHLPGPRRDALGVAFGLKAGPAPDRFLAGLATLSLLTEAAAGAPLMCLVDNTQWLDRASRQALAFAARRLPAGPVLMVLATREPSPDLSGLPELEVKGLPEADARALLTSVTRWPLDERVRNRIVAEARGNPRTLLAVPRAQSAGDLGLLDAQPLRDQAQPDQAGPGDLGGLPAPARLLLVIAAAEPAGDPALVWRAATRLGVPAAAGQPAVQAGLVAFGARVTFRHPLARSAAYRSVPPRERQRVHRALAEVTDPRTDPDRHAWQLAQAAAGPDEQVAAELERAAGRAQARGILATAAAFGEHAAALTPDPARRAGRALTGADAMVWAGAPDAALGLLALAESGPLDASQQARAALVRAKLAFASDRGSDAPPLLLEAARRLEPYDAALAQAAYLDAMHAAMFAGHLARPGTGAREVALAARASWPGRETGTPDPFGLFLDGLAAHFGQGPTAGLPVLRRAVRDFSGQVLAGQGLTGPGLTSQELRWLRLAGPAARHAWDDQAWDALSGRYLRLARDAGALSELPLALSRRAYLHLFSGDLAAAASLVDETPAASEPTGGNLAPYGALGLAAVRGRDDEARALIETVGKYAASRGEGTGVTAAKWASAVLGNGLGRYADALTAAGQAGQHPDELGLATWSQVELIEAAVRAGQPGRAADALGLLSEATSASGTDWALGVEARSRALLADGDEADSLYRDAIDRLAATRMRVDLARANLLYGEWLRRASRRVEARAQLRNAYEAFTRMGAEAFAERARRELAATGETVRKRAAETEIVLTAREGLIARLAGENHTNPQIAAQLFISTRTVEYHLAKVFAKLEISSRRELPTALRKLGLATIAT